jgi:hypothetical protein
MLRSLAIVFLILGFISPLDAQQAFTRLEPTAKELDASLRTDWYGVYLQGKKIGYLKMARDRVDPGIREVLLMHMKLTSFGQKADMVISQSMIYEAKPPYALTKAEYKEESGPTANKFTLTRTGPGTFDSVQTDGTNVRKKVVKGLDFSLADSMATELWIKRGPGKQNEIVVRDLDVKEQTIDTQANKLLTSKTSLVGGVEVKFYEIQSTTARDQISVVSRHDDQGKILSGKVAIFEVRYETEDQAKNNEYSQDLFVFGMAKIERPLGDLKQVKELVLEVNGQASAVVDGPRQSVAKDNGKTILRLGKRYGKEVKVGPKDAADNLKETSAYDLSASKVKSLAARAVGAATTDEAKVKNIAKFVHDFIDPRLGNTMPTIHDLIERKQGDCKSYALLFTTLARASGVPSREVSGLLYCGDDAKAFGGHAWNEVILNGVWVPVDASLNETEINATHICFGTDKMAAKNLLETLGNLKLRVVQVNASK